METKYQEAIDHAKAVIKRERRANGLTQSQLGDKMGLSAQQIAKYESGHDRLTFIRIIDISEALGIDPGDFYPRKGKGAPKPDMPGRLPLLIRNINAIENSAMQTLAVDIAISAVKGFRDGLDRLTQRINEIRRGR